MMAKERIRCNTENWRLLRSGSSTLQCSQEGTESAVAFEGLTDATRVRMPFLVIAQQTHWKTAQGLCPSPSFVNHLFALMLNI